MYEPATTRADKPILVIGGGITGMTAALEAAEAGCRVVLIEKSPYLGGRTASFHLYFPKLCPPVCGLEINLQRIKRNPRIQILTLAELERLEGLPGNYQATVKVSPRYVTEACTACNACAEVCPSKRADDFNAGFSKTKAVYLPFKWAFPLRYVIDRAACANGCRACVEACKYEAVNLGQQPERKTFSVAAAVVATGWEPYDASRIDNLGFGKYPNIVTNVTLERLAAPDGPTQGKIVRPSDGQPPKQIVFVQCAGSRDENHLPYCSSVCCAASFKQASYLRAQNPKAEITIFYIDIRMPGRLEEFYSKVVKEAGIRLIKGKVGRIEGEPCTDDLLITAEEILAGKKIIARAGLVVLATGIVPQTRGLPPGFAVDEFGFISGSEGDFYIAGCVKRPQDVAASVRDGTGAALGALQSVVRSVQSG